jgi:hypothetical protein
MHHLIRTTGVALSAAALSTGALVAPAASADPTPALRAAQAVGGTDSTPSTIAAEWISGELTNGLIVGEFGPDLGLTIDTGMAVSTVAGQGATVTAINTALEPRIADYIGDGTKESYAGALAKAAAFARTAKKNPTSYGGVNLIARLEERTANVPADPAAEPQAAAFAGRIFDKSEFGNFANVVGQSYAVRALTLANSAEAGAARDFLLKQQCASGYFRLGFDEGRRARASPVHRGCRRQRGWTRTPPSLAVINLVESRDTSPAVTARPRQGRQRGSPHRQRGSGAIRGAAGTDAQINTNTTALGGYAMGLLKHRRRRPQGGPVGAQEPAGRQVQVPHGPDQGHRGRRLPQGEGDQGGQGHRASPPAPATSGAAPPPRRSSASSSPRPARTRSSIESVRARGARRRARPVPGLRAGSRRERVRAGQGRLPAASTARRPATKIVRKLLLPTGNQRRVASREDLRRRGSYVAPGPQLTHALRTTPASPRSARRLATPGRGASGPAPGLRFAGRTRPGRHHTRPSWGKPVRNRR